MGVASDNVAICRTASLVKPVFSLIMLKMPLNGSQTLLSPMDHVGFVCTPGLCTTTVLGSPDLAQT